MTPEAPDRTFTIGMSLHSPAICALELRISLTRLEDGQRALQAVQPEPNWDLRDILEHLPDYVAGEGRLQKAGAMPADSSVPNYLPRKNPRT